MITTTPICASLTAPSSAAGRGQGTQAQGRQAQGRQTRRGHALASWRRQSRGAKIGYILASLIAIVAMVAGIGAFAIYRTLDGNITKVQVGHLSGKTVYGALNILVLGSQTRLGQRGHFGYDATPGVSNSDNLLLVHLDPTHTHAIVLSIPRDTFVYQPACKERRYVGTRHLAGPAVPAGRDHRRRAQHWRPYLRGSDRRGANRHPA